MVERRFQPRPATLGGAGRSLRRAADAVGVIGDIVAGHVVPRQRPRTPEGAAIRAYVRNASTPWRFMPGI
jgi:hypothetical protein